MNRYVVVMHWEHEVEARSPREAIDNVLRRSHPAREAVQEVRELIPQPPLSRTIPDSEYALDVAAEMPPAEVPV